MFKTKFILLDEDWNELYQYFSRVKPVEGEYIYIDKDKIYYKVLRVIHSIKESRQIILVVDKIKNELKK